MVTALIASLVLTNTLDVQGRSCAGGRGGGGRVSVRERDGALSPSTVAVVVVSVGAGAGVFGLPPSHESEK